MQRLHPDNKYRLELLRRRRGEYGTQEHKANLPLLLHPASMHYTYCGVALFLTNVFSTVQETQHVVSQEARDEQAGHVWVTTVT